MEILRSIAELMIWGDQHHNPAFFEYDHHVHTISAPFHLVPASIDSHLALMSSASSIAALSPVSFVRKAFWPISSNY